jgi:N-hydroxyarylamine O-acetyltransferase
MAYSDAQLGTYLARIGLDAAPAGLAGLNALQRAHRYAVTFENLDIALGRGIRIDPAWLFDKMVTGGRGGYCFEQNALFLGMLKTAGFRARPLLGRVWLSAAEGETPPRTHTLNLVDIDGTDFIADVGFGGSFVPPMPLTSDEVATTPDGVRHRLVRVPAHGWMLQRDGGSGWERQYSFTTEAVWPADLEAANHWTSTRPGTRFTTMRIVSRAFPDGMAALSDRMLTVRRAGEEEKQPVDDEATYQLVLRELFDLSLGREEVQRLGLFEEGTSWVG